MCHCGKPLTGAASRGRHGGYYYYYRCPTSSKHNNISAVKAHGQLAEILQYISLPASVIKKIKSSSEQMLDQQLRNTRANLARDKTEYQQAEDKLRSVEEKWLNNQLAFETYTRGGSGN